MFRSGKLFAVDMSIFSGTQSYFVQPTRETIVQHEGEWLPDDVFTMVLEHVPEGLKNIKVLGSTIRTSSSISIIMDLSCLPAGDGLTQEQTLARHLFSQTGLLLYRTANATLVRHVQRTLAWSLFPSKPATMITQPAKEANAPHLVYLQCPENLSTRGIKITAALIGKFEKLSFHSSLGQCTLLYSVVYSHSDSVALAHALTIEDVLFLPNVDMPDRKKELLHLDPEVNKVDRELVAIIDAEAKLGSRDAIMSLQELERRVMEAVEKLSVEEWVVETLPEQEDLVPKKTPPATKFTATENLSLGD